MLRKIQNSAIRLITVFAMLISLSSAAQAQDLVSMLTDQLGVTNKQAAGGAGSIFGYAKDNLNQEDFSTIAKGVPDMDSLLEAAPADAEDASPMGQAGSMLGGNSNMGGVASLASSFGALGLDPEMVTKFMPIVNEYIGSVSGEQAMGLLKDLF